MFHVEHWIDFIKYMLYYKIRYKKTNCNDTILIIKYNIIPCTNVPRGTLVHNKKVHTIIIS